MQDLHAVNAPEDHQKSQLNRKKKSLSDSWPERLNAIKMLLFPEVNLFI